ncbi:hypothetical protein U9M48_037251, partial [Paspalum notatum var. saurae]
MQRGNKAAGPMTLTMRDGERYEHVRDIGSGNFGVARLMRGRATGDLVAVKCIPRGDKVDENVQREVVNHRALRHPHVIRFKEVILTPTHLAITMEYASGGELFSRISNAGRFSEDEARFFFQQLISGVSYCHSMQVCHRDLKLENTLLDATAGTAPRLKICDFGYSKSAVLHSQPKSTVGTPAYIAPEMLQKKRYDGKLLNKIAQFLLIICPWMEISDVWSCGVTLYVMLVGGYPFEDPAGPKDFKRIVQRILGVKYAIPDYVHVSPECRDLLSRIFVVNPQMASCQILNCTFCSVTTLFRCELTNIGNVLFNLQRITLADIKRHPWFLKNLPIDLPGDGATSYEEADQPMQSMNDIMKILAEATISPPPATQGRTPQLLAQRIGMDEDMEDIGSNSSGSDPDLDLVDTSGE